jgi:hypothetical protein
LSPQPSINFLNANHVVRDRFDVVKQNDFVVEMFALNDADNL